MRCHIVPPHMLERIARDADDPALRARARRTLALTSAQFTERRMTAAGAPSPSEDFVPDRTINDAGHREELPGRTVRAEGAPATGDQTADRAYDWLGATFDFFETAFRRNSIDGAGLKMVSTVHYGDKYDNAFWNGEQMVYGDGDGTVFTDFTGPLDVTGHELTHGVTQYTANLEYYGQSGALNESMSDVFGSLIKQWHLAQTADRADWLIGQGLLAPGVDGVALRSMKEPGTAYDDPRLGKDPQPAHMDHYVDTHSDNGGVHINSGIPNHAFYLAATGIGGNAWEKAGRVWYDTLTGGSLATDVGFAGFAVATVQAATRLYGAEGVETKAVSKAWAGVGVPLEANG
ncbi:peptidase M4 family protein [Actinomadura darangshiensis]|uniref:Neutral metalloproteinase n=1 Tax=Actinomadura darangshiensis TaxID=705336 RepID=A0A4R5BAQ6_9ACTN|nr:M4 family metallopeptidase [Actinomadura darangshiensis]TDD80814.1 peptidase M4 family protein [Actinomadura darangshiensis]